MLCTLAMLAGRSAYAPVAAAGCPLPVILGREERVALRAAESAPWIPVTAKIDTGARYSALDQALADRLTLAPAEEEVVTMKSAFGRQRRRLVQVQLQIAGRTLKTVMTVSDRSHLSTAALIGNRDLAGFLVDPGALGLTSPDAGSHGTSSPVDCMPSRPSPTAATAAEDGLGVGGGPPGAGRSSVSPATARLPEEASTLLRLPVGVVVIVAFRMLIGAPTYGLFAPVLLALAFLQTGPAPGLWLFGLMLAVGIPVHPVLRRLKVTRLPRMALLLLAVILIPAGVQEGLLLRAQGILWLATFPMVITAALVEQLWSSWEQEGLAQALTTAIWTAAVTWIAALVMATEAVGQAAGREPLALVLVGAGICGLLGRYRGLRLLELWRFGPLLGREAAAMGVAPTPGPIGLPDEAVRRQR